MAIYNIYILENDAGFIKIGITQNFENRKRSLSGSNGGGHTITREYVSIDTHLFSLEHLMHDIFAQYRVPNTEWFEGISFEDVVSKLVELTSSDDYYKCENARAAFEKEESCNLITSSDFEIDFESNL